MENTQQGDLDGKSCKTPSEDLRNSALKHYEEASSSIHCWHSDIPQAINYYWDMHSDKPLTREDIESLGYCRGEIGYVLKERDNEGYDGIFLEHNSLTNKVYVSNLQSYEEHECYFNGLVKNKSELKTLLGWLGV